MTNKSLVRDLVKTTVAVERLAATEMPGNFTPGSVLFASATGRITQDASSFVWDATNNRLGVNVASPSAPLHIRNATPFVQLDTGNANEQYDIFRFAGDGILYFDGLQASPGSGFSFRPNNRNEVFRVAPTGRIGVNNASPSAVVDIIAAAATYNAEVGALRISLSTNTAKRFYMGWDNTLDGAYIQAVTNAVAYRPLGLNPAGGGVVIGQPNPPSRQLSINEATNPQIGFNKSTTEEWVIGVEGAASDRFIVYSAGGGGYAAIFNYANGYLGLGNTVAAYRIELPNTASASGQGRANAWVTYSSEVWKNNIRDADRQKHKRRIKRLRLREYEHRDDVGGGSTVGLIAEEVAEIYPELVVGDRDKPETLGLMYDRIGAVLLPEVQDHEDRVTELERKIEEQQRIINALIERLNRRGS